jgi:FKBP-type peptidyl-prolyl cis-trans isomerase FklB
MKKLMYSAVFCLTAFMIVSLFSCSAQAPKANLKTDIDSLSYAYGVQITEGGLDMYLQQRGVDMKDAATKAEFIKGFLEGSKIDKNDKKTVAYQEGISAGKQVVMDMFAAINGNIFGSDSTQTLNKAQLLAGFVAALENKNLLLKKEDVPTYVQTKTEAIQAKMNEKLKADNQAFLDTNKGKEGVITLPSGLQYKVVSEGKGPKPTSAEDTVKVNYKGMDITGKVFETNDSIAFPLNRVIPGWTEGIQLMSVGSKYTFYIPYNLAYGERGQQPRISPYATLIFDVELLNVSHATASKVEFTPPKVK